MEKNYYAEDAWGKLQPRDFLEQRERIVIRVFDQAATLPQVAIADLGCGDGCFLEALGKQHPSWTLAGLDGSSVQLEKARLRLQKADLRVANFNNPLPFADGQFDIVFAGEIIEHLTDPDFFLSEAYRILKKGGVICVTTPNLMAWYNRLLLLFGFSPIFVEYSSRDARVGYGLLKGMKEATPVGHLRIFHPDALLDAVALAGFQKPSLKSARFEYLPRFMRWLDDLISRVWRRGGSLLIVHGQKPL